MCCIHHHRPRVKTGLRRPAGTTTLLGGTVVLVVSSSNSPTTLSLFSSALSASLSLLLWEAVRCWLFSSLFNLIRESPSEHHGAVNETVVLLLLLLLVLVVFVLLLFVLFQTSKSSCRCHRKHHHIGWEF